MLACERNLFAASSEILAKSDCDDCEESADEMSLMEFLENYADLTAEQLLEVNTAFIQNGIHDFDALRHFATEDLISKLNMSEEAAKKVQLAIMKNTCLLFAELAEIGGIPLIRSEPVGSTETPYANQDADHMDEEKQPTCLVT